MEPVSHVLPFVLVFALQLNMHVLKIPDNNIIPNQVPDDDVTQRLHETCKTIEFMNPRKEPGDFSAHIFKNEDPQTTFVSETEGANSADVQVWYTLTCRWDKLNLSQTFPFCM